MSLIEILNNGNIINSKAQLYDLHIHFLDHYVESDLYIIYIYYIHTYQNHSVLKKNTVKYKNISVPGNYFEKHHKKALL